MTSTAKPANNLRHSSGNWITGNVGPFQVQAKAFDEESHYGMDEDRRISKLYVALPGETYTTRLYDYDRGDIDVNRLTAEGLAEIIAAVAEVI